jgi:hypothetical protein
MSDPTEGFRREMVSELNRSPGGREDLEAQYGQVWNTDEMVAEFQAMGFLAPYVHVLRRSDKARGTLMFQHNPRFYFSFVEG